MCVTMDKKKKKLLFEKSSESINEGNWMEKLPPGAQLI